MDNPRNTSDDDSQMIVALVKGEHRYVYLFDKQNAQGILGALEKSAADPELNFSWQDVAVLSQKVRELLQE